MKDALDPDRDLLSFFCALADKDVMEADLCGTAALLLASTAAPAMSFAVGAVTVMEIRVAVRGLSMRAEDPFAVDCSLLFASFSDLGDVAPALTFCIKDRGNDMLAEDFGGGTGDAPPGRLKRCWLLGLAEGGSLPSSSCSAV